MTNIFSINGRDYSELDIKNISSLETSEGKTIRQYLIALLLRLWEDGEGFSGKRPFGDSGWHYIIYTPLLNAGYIDGSYDDEGYVMEVDKFVADKLIEIVIKHL